MNLKVLCTHSVAVVSVAIKILVVAVRETWGRGRLQCLVSTLLRVALPVTEGILCAGKSGGLFVGGWGGVLYPELDGKMSGTPVLAQWLVTEGCCHMLVWILKNWYSRIQLQLLMCKICFIAASR